MVRPGFARAVPTPPGGGPTPHRYVVMHMGLTITETTLSTCFQQVLEKRKPSDDPNVGRGQSPGTRRNPTVLYIYIYCIHTYTSLTR